MNPQTHHSFFEAFTAFRKEREKKNNIRENRMSTRRYADNFSMANFRLNVHNSVPILATFFSAHDFQLQAEHFCPPVQTILC